MKKKTIPPSIKEAFSAIPDLLYLIEQCLACHIWASRVKPTLISKVPNHMVQIIENSVIEATLLSLRKLNEFFGSRTLKNQDGTLRAYHFGDYPCLGWFLTEDEYEELHIRVGHVSVEEVRHGKKDWPIDDYVLKAIIKSKDFLAFLCQHPEINPTNRDKITNKIDRLNLYERQLRAEHQASGNGKI